MNEEKISKIDESIKEMVTDHLKLGFRIELIESKFSTLEADVIKTRQELLLRMGDLTKGFAEFKEEQIRADERRKVSNRQTTAINILFTVMANVCVIGGFLKIIGVI